MPVALGSNISPNAYYTGTQLVDALRLGTVLVYQRTVVTDFSVAEQDVTTIYVEEDGTTVVNEEGGGAALPVGVLETVNPSALAATITVDSGARHRWDGFGWGIDFNPASGYNTLVSTYANKLFEQLNTKWLNAYTSGIGSAYQSVHDTGFAHGVTGFVCSGDMVHNNKTAVTFANEVSADITAGARFTHAVKQNEPDGNALNQWASDAVMVQASIDVRSRLDALGRTGIKLIGDAWAHFGSSTGALSLNNEYTQHANAGLIPGTLTAGAGHAYGDCARPSNFDSRWMSHAADPIAGMFQLEHGNCGVPRSPACYLSCLNNGCGVYVNFGGPSTGADFVHNLINNSGVEAPYYWHYWIINQILSLNSRFRLCHCDDRPSSLTNSSPEFVADRMVRALGGATTFNPRINAMCAQRPDGKWVITAVNNTYGADDFTLLGGAHYGAQLFQLTWTVAELVGTNLTFTGQRADINGAVSSGQTYSMVNGQIRFTLQPGDTLSLLSGAAQAGVFQSRVAIDRLLMGDPPALVTGSQIVAGDPDMNNSINAGLKLFIGSHPVGATELATERVSRTPVTLVGSTTVTTAHPDHSTWRCLRTAGGTSLFWAQLTTQFKQITGDFTLWFDLILNSVASSAHIMCVPWDTTSGWTAPFVAWDYLHFQNTDSARWQIQFNPDFTTLTPYTGAALSHPLDLNIRRRYWVRRVNTTLTFGIGAAAVGSTQQVTAAAPNWAQVTSGKISFGGRKPENTAAEALGATYIRSMAWNRGLSDSELVALDSNPDYGLSGLDPGGGGVAFADEFAALSLETVKPANGSANWSWYFVGWNAHALDGNSEKCWKSHANYVPNAGAQTPAQQYPSAGANVLHEVSAGTLKLYGRVNNDPDLSKWFGYGYIGGMITSEKSQFHTYGTWEFRLKFAVTKGQHWSAWMVQTNTVWPPEIDIVEVTNDGTANTQNRLFINAHGYSGDTNVNGVSTDGSGTYWLQVADTTAWQAFHVYKFVWTPTVMEWWVDGVKRRWITNFVDLPMFLQITPEVAGNWEGLPDGTTTWPMVGEVDYVHHTPFNSERVLPASLQASANLQSNALTQPPPITDIDDDPVTPDALWWKAVNAGLDTSARVRMATPSATLTGVQSLRAVLRKTAGGIAPNVILRLWQNGTQLTSTKTVSVSSTSGAAYSLDFDASELTGNTNIELEVAATASSSGFSETFTGADNAAWNAARWPTIELGAVGGNTSTATIVGNAGRMIAQGSSGAFHWIRAFAAVGIQADFDVTLKFVMSGTGEQYHTIYVRSGTGQSINNATDPDNGYRIEISFNTSAVGSLTWSPIVASVRGTAVTVAKAWGTTQWNMRISCVGTAQRVRAWQGIEPSTWDIDQTNAQVASGGMRLVALNGSGSGAARQITWDDVVLTPAGGAVSATVEIGAVDLLAQRA